jgi:hypothetical protein
MNTLNISSLQSVGFEAPSLGSQLFELIEGEIPPITWAAGLEMEATYILNPLDTDKSWVKGLEEFYILDIGKIIEYNDKKYKDAGKKKYPYLELAESSGRMCTKKYIIKPDPKNSMLEIVTDKPYSIVHPRYGMTDILYYARYLIDIQIEAIRNLNEFYYNEKLWKNKKTYYSIIPYPYAMSDRLKNANIVLGNMKNTKLKTNYTGSYHLTLTLPFYSLSYDIDQYYEQYKRYINQFQWIEPLIVALYTTTDMRGIGSKTVYSRASYRILLSGWGQPGGSDVRKFEEGLTRKVNIPLYWREGMNYPGMEDVKKYCANPDRKYDIDHVDPDRNIYDMGGDFRTPSGEHGESWKVRDRLKGKYFGVEMRILDVFPPKYIASFLRIVAFLVENSRESKNKIYVYEDKDWIDAMQSVFKSGWRAELPKKYIDKLEIALNLKFPKKPKMLDAFWTIFLKVLYEKNYKGFFVAQLLSNMMKDDFSKNISSNIQPPLEKRNPNRESVDFGILLKLNNSVKIRNVLQKTFQLLPINSKITLEKLEKHYHKTMDSDWKNNMIDLVYFFEYRDGLSIIPNNDGFIKYITITQNQHLNIGSIIENYMGSIVNIWPELINYNSGSGSKE